jgi:hypothetical protein
MGMGRGMSEISETVKSDRCGLCSCGASIPLDLRLPHGLLVRCPQCGQEQRAWAAAIRANRKGEK